VYLYGYVIMRVFEMKTVSKELKNNAIWVDNFSSICYILNKGGNYEIYFKS